MTPGTVDPVDPHPAAGPAGRVSGPTVPPDTAPPERTSAEKDASVVLSAERAHLSTVAVPVGRVRLQKVIVSREETVTVVVRREELRVVHEDLPPGTTSSPEVSPVRFDLVLHEERLIVDRVVVPVERVHVTVDRVTETVDVTTTLRHERVDVSTTAAGPGDDDLLAPW